MTLREEALHLFQKVRKLELAGQHNGFVQCPYCRRWIKAEESVAVHFIPRQYRSLEVEKRNVYAGCAFCNGQDQLQSNAGEYHDRFEQWIRENFGEWTVEWLYNRKRVMVKHGSRYYKELIDQLKKELKEYGEEKEEL